LLIDFAEQIPQNAVSNEVSFREHSAMAAQAGAATALIKRVDRLRVALAVIALIVVILLIYGFARFFSNSPVKYSNIEESFRYGSTGGEINAGIPYSVWLALPDLFPEFLPDKTPGRGYRSLGFLYEDGKDLPIGVSKRKYQGIERVFFNCAICHVGSVRDSASSAPQYVAGMPSNTVDLRGFYEFMFNAAASEKFNAGLILAEIKEQGTHEDLINQLILRFYAVNVMQTFLIARRDRLQFIMEKPEYGPGRIDTFNPPKALFNFNMSTAREDELYGVTDFPSIWNQGKREGMHLHWDGNNTSVEERNRSAAFGTGAYPPTLDRKYMESIAKWLYDDAKPPKYRYSIDSGLAARGAQIYAQMCAYCHGQDGSHFKYGDGRVGEVTPIEQIKTDPNRLNSYTEELAVNQSLLYAGYGNERFSHFRKTFGYANMPLDGLWLRAPYLHNGSVPNLRELLEPSAKRSKVFYRGDDVYDPANVGFESNVPERDGRKFFRYDTSVRGNGNQGHEGKEYGTELSPADKNALLEYLKTF
jgi:hypothetical protein